MKIKSKLNISFISISLSVFIILGFVISIYVVSLVKNNIFSYLHSSNRARAEHVRTFIQDQKNAASILAGASVYLDFINTPPSSDQYSVVKAKIDSRFIRTMSVDPNLIDINILDLKGIIIASSNIKEEGESEAGDDYFIEGLKGPYIKEVYFYDNQLTYAVSAPIVNNSGKVLGVSLLRYKPNKFYTITGSENGLGPTEENFLVNSDKYFITPSLFLGSDVILKQKIQTENILDCFDPDEVAYVNKNGYSGLTQKFGNQIIQALDYRNVNVIATHAYIPEIHGCLVTKVDVSDAFSFVDNFLIIVMSLFLCSLIAVFFVGNYVSKIITSAIDILKFKAEKIKKGDYSDSENVKTKDELKELDEIIRLMTKKLRDENIRIEQVVKEQTLEINKERGDLDDQKSAILNILEDVEVEKNKAEELGRIVLNANESIISKTLDGIVTTWNKGAENLYGYTAEEIIGKSIMLVVPKDKYKEISDITKKVSEGKSIERFQTIRKKKDGLLVEVSLSAAPIYDAADKIIGVSVIAIDITKERAIDKAKTEFVSLASHQLRTPLSAINWYTEMLIAGDVGKINKQQKDYLSEVYHGSQRMVELINALLNVSRLDLGTFILTLSPVDVTKLVKSLITELSAQIKLKKEVIVEKYEANLPLLPADQNFLRIIIQNLMSNAVKYTLEKGQISIEVSVIKAGTKIDNVKFDKDSFAVKVSDSGIGIPLGQKDKIFDKLFRADNAKQLETEGTGLGLYIVKSIIDKSGGKIWFTSVENKGTTFVFTYPLTGMKKIEEQGGGGKLTGNLNP